MSSPVVLELGSHSLKVHYVSASSGILRKTRFAWDLGHEVYSTGRISRASAARAVATIEELRQKGIHPRAVLAIATGALRDATNSRDFVSLLEERLELKVRIISGREEASLLAQAYLETSDRLPALITDIGGGSLEFVYLGEDRTILRDSLPLGAIRLYHFGQRADGSFDEELVSSWIEDSFGEASLIRATEIHSTGGTAKAIAKSLDKSTATFDEVVELERKTRRDGPPGHLKPDRARVFLPGLLVLRKAMEHAGAERLTYLKAAIGRVFLQKYAGRLSVRTRDARNDLLRDLRITQIYPRKSSIGLPLEKKADDRRSDGGHEAR